MLQRISKGGLINVIAFEQFAFMFLFRCSELLVHIAVVFLRPSSYSLENQLCNLPTKWVHLYHYIYQPQGNQSGLNITHSKI